AIFGVNLRYRFPLIAGCLGGAVAGVYVYFTHLVSLGFGTTAVPGIAIVDPSNNGYVNYIIAHLIGLSVAFILTIVFGKMTNKKIDNQEIVYPTKGDVKGIEECSDETFASKSLGEGIVIDTQDGIIVSPCKATVEFIFPTKHAIGLRLENGAALLIHCGINTVELNGEGFETFVNVNDVVKPNDKLIKMDLATIKEKGYNTQVVTIMTELPETVTVHIDTTNKTWFSFN
ncbi:glucose PTS transporter subunit IIA, partial [Anaerorhabdus sp.]